MCTFSAFEQFRYIPGNTTGDVLYRFNTGGPMGGGVVTYAAGGRQYIAVASGSPSNFWTESNAGSPTIVVFALPREPHPLER